MVFNYYIRKINKIRADYNYQDKKYCFSWVYSPEYNGKAKRYDWEILWDVRIFDETSDENCTDYGVIPVAMMIDDTKNRFWENIISSSNHRANYTDLKIQSFKRNIFSYEFLDDEFIERCLNEY